MNHLDKQLKETQGCKEALKISRRREDALQTQVRSWRKIAVLALSRIVHRKTLNYGIPGLPK